MAQAGRSIGIGPTAMRCRHGHNNEVVIAAKLPAVRADVDFPSRRLSVTSPPEAANDGYRGKADV